MDTVIKKIPNKNSDKRVSKIKLRIKIKDSTGNFKITDIMLQGGSKGTTWNAHPSEVRWAFNE